MGVETIFQRLIAQEARNAVTSDAVFLSSVTLRTQKTHSTQPRPVCLEEYRGAIVVIDFVPMVISNLVRIQQHFVRRIR